MPDISNAPAPEAQPEAAPVSTPAESNAPISMRDAASALSKRRWEKAKETQAAPDPVPTEPDKVEAPTELADEANAAPDESPDPGETEVPEPAEQTPPIERPRSWTKDEDTEWQSLPRAMQQKIVAREQERDTGLRRSQNEAAEKLKGLTAKEQAVEQARQQYETALPALLQSLQETQAGTFADIKTSADVNRLAQEDPFRYLQWTAHRDQVAAVHKEMQGSQERQAQDWQRKWADFAEREDKLTAEKIPELADPAQRTKVQDGAIAYLKDIGFQESELGSAWNGQASLSLRDHRVQGLIRDAVKYRDGQANAKKVIAAKPLPPVQRPGVVAPRNNDSNIQALSKKLETTGRMEDAAAVVAARRAARR